MLRQDKGYVRSVDAAARPGYAKPAIREQMKRFQTRGSIEMNESGHITLTERGSAIASRIDERHMVIAQILMSLGAEEAAAYAVACKIEHDLSEQSFRCMRRHFWAHQKTLNREDMQGTG